jgi:hypothetical protein
LGILRLLVASVLLNPVDAIRIGALLVTEGTAAFGSASLAFFRFTIGLIPPAVCFGTGFGFGLFRRHDPTAGWANGAALFTRSG